MQANQFKQIEKNSEINRENQILLSKLVEISTGKWSSVNAPKKGKKKKKAITAEQKKSLNYGWRRAEYERIERENAAFAQRLLQKKGAISKKTMDQDFKKHKKYVKQIKKVPAPKKTKKQERDEEEEHKEGEEASPEAAKQDEGTQTDDEDNHDKPEDKKEEKDSTPEPKPEKKEESPTKTE